MKLPKCPHCEKLMVAVIGETYKKSDVIAIKDMAVYLCPETLARWDPDWVEVLEV